MSSLNTHANGTEPVPCKGGFWEPTPGPLPAEARCTVCKQLAVLHPHRHVVIEGVNNDA